MGRDLGTLLGRRGLERVQVAELRGKVFEAAKLPLHLPNGFGSSARRIRLDVCHTSGAQLAGSSSISRCRKVVPLVAVR
jgi:hypothetical protein